MPSSDQILTQDELRALESILSKLSGPGADLPQPLFRFLTELTSTPNIDLLVQDSEKGVLLAWRDDPFGTGWHVPGSLIRHGETVAHRLMACAREELGCDIKVADRPIALIEIFDDRGHCISLCYPASLSGIPGKRVLNDGEDAASGDLKWFKAPPAQFYPSHLIYREILEALSRGELGEGARLFQHHSGRRNTAHAPPEGAIGADRSLI
jgi:colanic acid biosynthesis protein WcaH